MKDDDLRLRATIVIELRDGASNEEGLYDCLSDPKPPREALPEHLAALIECGAIVREGASYLLSDKALDAMERGVRTAAECVVSGADAHPALEEVRATERAADVFGHLSFQLYRFAKSAHRSAGAWIAAVESQPALLDAMRAAYEAGEAARKRLPPDWPRITLEDCAAWAAAIVGACEALYITGGGPYQDALVLSRALSRGALDTGAISIGEMREQALRWARHGSPRCGRVYAALIAVRMLAAEAAKEEG